MTNVAFLLDAFTYMYCRLDNLKLFYASVISYNSVVHLCIS